MEDGAPPTVILGYYAVPVTCHSLKSGHYCCSIGEVSFFDRFQYTTDIQISQVNKYRLMATAAGRDQLFALTGYISHMLHHLLISVPWISLHLRLGFPTQLRNKTRSATTDSTPAQHRLLALSKLMSETRYTLRLLGLFKIWTTASETLRYPSSDAALYKLKLLQVVIDAVYQALENVGYLCSKGIMSKRFVDKWGGINEWYLWSRRFYFGNIMLRFISLWREDVLRKRRISRNLVEKLDGDLQAEIQAWKKRLISNICWAPLFLHWSFEKGIGFPDKLYGAFGTAAGIWGFYDMWVATGGR